MRAGRWTSTPASCAARCGSPPRPPTRCGLPEALAAFHRDHPGVRVALRHASVGEALALLRSGAVDLGVLSLARRDRRGPAVTRLFEEPLRAISSPDEPFGAVVVGVEDLQGRPFVLGEPGSALRTLVMDACQDHGFSPVPLLEVGDPATVRFLVSAGLGVSLVPLSWLEPPGTARVGRGVVEPAPRHALSLLAAGELPPAGRILAQRLRRLSSSACSRDLRRAPTSLKHRLAAAEHHQRRHREHLVAHGGLLVLTVSIFTKRTSGRSSARSAMIGLITRQRPHRRRGSRRRQERRTRERRW